MQSTYYSNLLDTKDSLCPNHDQIGPDTLRLIVQYGQEEMEVDISQLMTYPITNSGYIRIIHRSNSWPVLMVYCTHLKLDVDLKRERARSVQAAYV